MRIQQHPILEFEAKAPVRFTFNGKPMEGVEGDTVASALHAADVRVLGHSIFLHRPRGFFCAIGNCSSCMMIVDNVPNVKTCITPLREGMDVRLQEGLGVIE